MEDYLEHHGIKGQKWGVRRYQNIDGTLTEEGKKRKNTVFISGSSKTQDKESPYYRKNLPKEIKKEINSYVKNNKKIIVGDAPGIDRQVQNYLKKINYDNVEIYGPGEKVRYSANKKWKTNPIDSSEFEFMSPEYLRKKDIAMTNASGQGLAIILDNGAQATRNNVTRLINQSKKVKVYEINSNGKKLDRFMHNKEIKKIFKTKIKDI